MEVWRGIEEGLNSVIVNPSIIIGPGNWGKNSSALILAIAKGIKFYPSGITGFIDVRDVVKAMIALMNSNISGERFIVNSENCSCKFIFQWIASALGVKTPSLEAKPWMGSLAWRAEWLKGLLLKRTPRITHETIKSVFISSFYSTEKIKKAIEIEFIPIKKSIEDTCKLFLEYFPSHPSKDY
jgi:nucleoside-diphosphate-sugar epimerase